MGSVKGCHYQDEPCRCGLCLREHHLWMTSDGEGDRPFLSLCDESIAEVCQHRAWDHELSLAIMRSRSNLIDRCQACGRRHRTLKESVRCELEAIIDAAFSSTKTWHEQGCAEDLFGSHIPDGMARIAWTKVRRRVLERDGFRCQECGRDLRTLPGWFTEVHHILPRTRGGTNHPANLATLCVSCHKRKTETLLWEKAWEKGFDLKEEA